MYFHFQIIAKNCLHLTHVITQKVIKKHKIFILILSLLIKFSLFIVLIIVGLCELSFYDDDYQLLCFPAVKSGFMQCAVC